jgi:hypothetical protein
MTVLPVNPQTLTLNNKLPRTAAIERATDTIRMVVPVGSVSTLFGPIAVPQILGDNFQMFRDLGTMFDGAIIPRVEPTGFNSIKELVGIEYAGYIVEKERLNRATEQWVRIDEYRIIGQAASSFVDTRITYGEIYRYRIKNVIRVTKKQKVREQVENTAYFDVNKIFSERLTQAINKNLDYFQNTNAFTNLGIANKNVPTKLQIPLFGGYIAKFDGTSVDVIQQATNSATDPRLAKNSRLSNISVIGKNFNVYLPIIDQFVFVDRIKYLSHYYESYPSKNWTYVDVYENVPPPPPESIKINANSLNKQVFIQWLKPSNGQRDIKAFRIYKRDSFNKNWLLRAEVPEMNVGSSEYPDARSVNKNSANLFIDNTVQFGKKYIFALTSIDIHGIESFLSTQIQVELNANFAVEKEEKPLKWISGSGARLDEINYVYKKFLNRTEQIKAKSSIKIKPSLTFSDASKTFLIRITSLDTHQKKEVRVTVTNSNVQIK